MVAGGLRTAAYFLSFGFELFNAALDGQETQSAVIGWSRDFFIGNASAYFISTALFQFVFQRKLALTIVAQSTLTLSLQYMLMTMGQIFSDFALPRTINFFIFGFIDGSTYLLIFIIGPLLVASAHRKTFEITMGGAMITLVMMMSFLIGAIIALCLFIIGI